MTIASVIAASVPLMLATFGALVSDCAGRLAIFMEGIINLSAFLCFAFTLKLQAVPGCMLAVLSCMAFVSVFLAVTEKTKADPFLMGLSLNITSSACVSLLSSIFFGTRGVLSSGAFAFDAPRARTVTTIAAIAVLAVAASALMLTKKGLYLRLCGSNADVLEDSGINAHSYVCASWIIAAAFGALAGCTIALRLSSFVPGVASGSGWLSGAVVYIARSIGAPIDGVCRHIMKGRRVGVSSNPAGHNHSAAQKTGWTVCLCCFFVSIAISLAVLFASHMQNVWPDVASSFTLAMPYIACLVLLALIGQKR